MIHSPRKGRAGLARPAIYAALLASAALATAATATAAAATDAIPAALAGPTAPAAHATHSVTAASAAATVTARGPAAKPAASRAQGTALALGVPVTSQAELRAISAGNAALAPAARFPLDALMARAAMREVRFAPDGSAVAFLTQAGPAASLHLYDIASGTTRTLTREAPRGALTWSTDGSTLFVDDAAGISAVSAKDGAISKVVTYDGKLESKVLNVDLRRPRHMLVGIFDRQAGNYTLFSYGADGSREQLYQGAPLRDAMLDQKGQPLFIKSLAADYTQVISRRDGSGWKEVMRCKPVRPCTMLEAAPDGKRLKMMMGYQDDRTSLVLVDARTGAQRLLHSDPLGIADLRSYAPDPQSGEVLAVGYDLPVRRQYAATPAARRAVADIGERFAGANITLSAAAGGKRWMVAESRGDLHQPRYWVYDATKREATEILQAERALGKPLAQDTLAPKHAISYRASDGMAIHGYLTLPRGADAAKAPLLTMVHGGPWSRFDGEYHWLAQWLANRGVAVFQPNFRASTGYGEKYMLAPGMDFGNGRVQRDIIEGVQWLLANGIGDQSRLAILGDSFGGYATLMALTHTPDMFQFGLAAVPPSDFSRVIELAATENLAGTEDLPTSMRFSQMGISPANAAAMAALRADSPIANTAKVKRPLVILAGGKDEKVEIASVNEYVAKLDVAGKPVTLLVDPAEGHNPRKPVVRLAYVNLLERLLHDYLGGPQPEPCTPDLCRYLEQHLKLNNALRK